MLLIVLGCGRLVSGNNKLNELGQSPRSDNFTSSEPGLKAQYYWEDSELENSDGQSNVQWRQDGFCGTGYPLADGTPAQCDPDSENPCCDDTWYGRCGNSTESCSCHNCTDYGRNRIRREWLNSTKKQKTRYDGKCGSIYPFPGSSTPAECDSEGDKPCCSDWWDGRCGNTSEHCTCASCTNFRYMKDWEDSGGKLRWRYDGKCGYLNFLPNGSPAQCDPNGENLCCNDTSNGQCGNTTESCSCPNCTDYGRINSEWMDSSNKQKTRYDGKCGSMYLFPGSSTTAECDPEGDKPCCSDWWDGRCGNTSEHCLCASCTNYRYLKDWEDSGKELRWRHDGFCGTGYPMPDGSPAQCDPEGKNPCCSDSWGGQCGYTPSHCSCTYCIDYRTIHREWRLSEGSQRWWYNGFCGNEYLLPDKTPVECNPDGDKPCCDLRLGICTSSSCSCKESCIDYKFAKAWKESDGKLTWRPDNRCGREYSLPDGSPSECDPDGDFPCCDRRKERCLSELESCLCADDCVDYSSVKAIRRSSENCTVVRIHTGYLKHVCFNETTKEQYFLCSHPKNNTLERYTVDLRADYSTTVAMRGVSEVCENDPYSYQSCGFGNRVTNSAVLCGGYICKKKNKLKVFTPCTGEYCEVESRNCSQSLSVVDSSNVCNDRCDSRGCQDESYCNGYSYGLNCLVKNGTGEFAMKYLPVSKLCGKRKVCKHEEDQRNCYITMNTIHICELYENGLVMPILQNRRCSAFYIAKNKSYDDLFSPPYCSNFLDQTNCSDVKRIGGYCQVNGFQSSISIFMVCSDVTNPWTNLPVDLCDDSLQNKCLSPYPGCKIHKHWMCNEEKDCSDGIDETHEICATKTDSFNFTCIRRFLPHRSAEAIPVSWIMDMETDCIDGEDENFAKWELHFCLETGQILLPGKQCEDVFKCYHDGQAFVSLHLLCDGIDSCGDGTENEVCMRARDRPDIWNHTTAVLNGTVRSVCNESISTCEIKEFTRPWGRVFGEEKIELYVPTSRVYCNETFGERYFFLSFMNLCKESNTSLLSMENGNRKLEYNSCPGQFPDRTYTLGNNSYLTFVDKTEEGRYHQNYYKCDNGRCVGYEQVCDLIDDCGDMSDEINCVNHVVCKDTSESNSTKKQLISLSQKCDGIYDCFDLSDECNESCKRYILENWIIKFICWTMGILTVLFNISALARSFASLKDCATDAMLTSKVLLILIGSGDLLTGLYLVILSVYDNIIHGEGYCRHQPEWLTGLPCMILGVISTVGTQISLFSMTVISLIRMIGIKSMRIPVEINKIALGRIAFLSFSILAFSLAIAITPLMPPLEDYFVQGMYHDPANKIFIGFPNKDRHISVLKSYYNKTQIKDDISWEEIREKVDNMFKQYNGSFWKKPVHFYGNDGVCLFKYFVRADDARRSRQSDGSDKVSDPVVWAMLAINLFCFVIMSVCYIAIVIHTKQSSQRSGQQDNPLRNREDKAVQKRVMIIIVTDFLCWVPFIFISGLHNLDYIDASKWYASFAMIVLPLNSVINPLVYDKKLTESIKRQFIKTTKSIRSHLASVTLPALEFIWERRSNDEPESIRMEPLAPNNEIAKGPMNSTLGLTALYM